LIYFLDILAFLSVTGRTYPSQSQHKFCQVMGCDRKFNHQGKSIMPGSTLLGQALTTQTGNHSRFTGLIFLLVRCLQITSSDQIRQAKWAISTKGLSCFVRIPQSISRHFTCPDNCYAAQVDESLHVAIQNIKDVEIWFEIAKEQESIL